MCFHHSSLVLAAVTARLRLTADRLAASRNYRHSRVESSCQNGKGGSRKRGYTISKSICLKAIRIELSLSYALFLPPCSPWRCRQHRRYLVDAQSTLIRFPPSGVLRENRQAFSGPS